MINEFISEEEYEEFKSLNLQEQIYFIYDIFISDSNVSKLAEIMKKVNDVVSSAIDLSKPLNIMMSKNWVVINSDSLGLITLAHQQLILSGYILEPEIMSPQRESVMKRQKYVRAYRLVSKLPPIGLN